MYHTPPEISKLVPKEVFKNGVNVKYYKDKDFKQLSKEETAANIDIYWYDGRPDFVTDSMYSVRWEGKITAPETGKYQFQIKSFDSRVIVFNGDTLKVQLDCNEPYFEFLELEKGKEYPLLMYVYGGPGSQEVLNSQSRFSDYMWFRMLAQKGYVVACVDGRGTGMRGEEFKKCTYMELGKYETEDQIEAAKYFGSLDFIDKDRIGIFGWSYGGYMSTLCITKGADYFKTAIAVAPVTTWRYYDNVYTERFMRTPQENPSGYDDNSPINHVEKLKGNYLLVHGTADDNVHFQNAVDLMTALIKANKQFEQFSYPNKNHGIYGGNTRLHLYTLMTDFIFRKL
jgi:dienelactone hydrolase